MDLRIWNITHTQALREQLAEEQMRQFSKRPNPEPLFYWHIEQYAERTVRGKRVAGWVFLRDFHGTKADAARKWDRFYRNADRKYRLRLVSRLGK